MAGLLTELCVCAALAVALQGLHQIGLPLAAWPLLAALGVAAGGAYGLAEATGRRLGWGAGLLLGVALAPLVALVVPFLVAVLSGSGVLAGYRALAAAAVADPAPHLAVASGALALYGPLLVARLRGVGALGQTYVMTGGLLVWLFAVALLDPRSYDELNLTLYLLPLAGRVVGFPALLLLGDRAVDRALRVLGQEAPARAAAKPRGAGPAPGPRQREQARWQAERAAVHLERGEPGKAATRLATAFRLAPSAERAVATARAYAAADEPYLAIEWLGKALQQPGADPAALRDPALAPLAGLVEYEALLEQTNLPRSPAPPRPGRRTRAPGGRAREGLELAGHAVMACALAVLAAFMIQPAYTPDVPAEVSRLALWHALAPDGQRAFDTALRLELGWRATAARPAPREAWIPGVLAALGAASSPGQDPVAATSWYRRAGEAGHAEGMHYYALACLERRDHARAARWLRRAAEAGHADAMWRLALALRFGRGLPRDVAAAQDWLRRGCAAGSADAMYQLGLWLRLGRDGVTPDPEEAARWLREARALGHPLARRELVGGE